MDLSACAAQTELQTQQHGGTPEQPHSTDWGSKQNQEAGEKNCECVEGQGGGGTAGEGKNIGLEADEQTGQWENESNCRYTGLQSMTKPEVRFNLFIHCPLDACLALLFSLFDVSIPYIHAL